MGQQQRSLFGHPETGVLRLPEVAAATGLSASTVLRLERAGAFPPARRLGLKSVGWLETEVLEWLHSRPVRSAAARAGADDQR